MTASRLLLALFVTTAILLLGTCITVLVTLFAPVPTLTYTQPSLGVPTPFVKPGSTVPLVVAYCKETDLGEHIAAQIVSTDADRLTKSLGALERNLETGCHTITTSIWVIPTDTAPCRSYTAQFTVTYVINAWRTEVKHAESTPFYIGPTRPCVAPLVTLNTPT